MSENGRIPSSWQWTTLGAVTQVVGGGTPKSGESDYWHGDVPWITPADLSGYHEKTIAHGGRNITETGLARSAARLLPTGTVLFSSRAPIGYVAIAANQIATNQGFKSFVPPRDISPSFLYYYLRSAKSVAIQSASGTTFKELSKKRAALLPFPLAPLPEQHRIVEKIESLFERLDEGIAALKRAETNLERYRASVLKAAVEGRLTEQWRKENPLEETGGELLRRILVERRERWEMEQLEKFESRGRKPPRNWTAKYKEPVPPDTSGLPELPEGWCWATVDELAPVIQYGHTASADPSKQDGPRFLRITDIQRGRVQWPDVPGCAASEAETEKYRLSEGDIVFARTGATTGKSYRISEHPDAIFASYLIRVGLSDPVHSRYVSVFFQSSTYWAQIERGKRGIGQPNVNARVLAHITLPLPPLCEQVEIAERVEYAENAVRPATDRFISSCRTTASALRQSILKRAFEGRLVPQDPTDEPASVLLNRIRVERQAERKRSTRRAPRPRRQRRSRIP